MSYSPTPVPASSRAFTLVELLTVIAIIAILAGLVLSTAGYIQKKAARSRAEAEIAAMEAALESYKADNGSYPRGPASDALNPNTKTPASYKAASVELYRALSGDTNLNRQYDNGEPKAYFEFKPQMLEPSGSSATTVTAIIDPWGNSYGYSTIYAKQAETGTPTAGRNPTFDLWSTAGETAASPKVGEVGWIKNW